MTKLSVIIPVYNMEKYLTRCLNSVTKQTLIDIEIICVNDGSTDKSQEILEQYAKKDNRIKIIKIENSGQAVARNTGISAATGEYLGFVDSDDWIDKNYFEKMYNTAKKYDAPIACAGFKRFKYANGQIKKQFKYEKCIDNINDMIDADNVPEHCYIWNKIYKRKNWIDANMKFPENMIFEDIAIILKILNSLGPMVTVPNVYYHYRRRKNSTVTQNNAKAKEDYKSAYNLMLEYANKNNIKLGNFNTNCRKLYVKICGIKFMKIKCYPQKIKCLLFGFIPFLTLNINT